MLEVAFEPVSLGPLADIALIAEAILLARFARVFKQVFVARKG